MELSLSASEARLLSQLALASIRYAADDAIALAVRGLDEEQVHNDIQSLTWRGMVAADGDFLSLTPLGAAAHYACEAEELSARLVDVCTLADALEHLHPNLACGTHAVRQVAQGAWSLERARQYAVQHRPGRLE
ncbi:hypothetical protein ACH429_08005 [Streptomyces pathocidini]|uniref:Uncharacterized protein n=1 Tax=Streptomyces pathocidini TaxID=1650571 RepID=A0ABW7UQC8_9ACTN|nr:hypothetical protein [Streptomyces pathocidini]